MLQIILKLKIGLPLVLLFVHKMYKIFYVLVLSAVSYGSELSLIHLITTLRRKTHSMYKAGRHFDSDLSLHELGRYSHSPSLSLLSFFLCTLFFSALLSLFLLSLPPFCSLSLSLSLSLSYPFVLFIH